METLTRKLGIDARHRVISIVGSGGKTTLLYALAREFAAAGEKTVLTTTTHIRQPDEPDFLISSGPQIPLPPGRITVAGTPAPDGKLSAPPAEAMDFICKNADRVLIEADGSRMLPVKFPSATEPVIVPGCDLVIAVAGLSALGKPLQAVCHRAPLAQEALGLPPDRPVTPEVIAKLLLAGYRRWNPVVLLNQADHAFERSQAKQAAKLLRAGGIGRVLILSLRQEVLNDHAGTD